MLLSSTPIVGMLLSGGTGWLADGVGEAPLRSGDFVTMPHDPPTLTLALIGIGTIAVYLAATWRWRRDAPRAAGRLSDQPELSRADTGLEEKRTRGAA